jgi:rRNA small subunit pseudouridine methyltransferase Nep1
MPLHFVLAEAEVETVPESVASHPQVQAVAEDRGRPPTACLLDASDHHGALDELGDGPGRGRPDIAHYCALLALDSPLNEAGGLETRIHCRGDRLLEVNPETRLIRHYPRFLGLVEHLFEEGQVPADRDPPLLRLEEDRPLEGVLDEAPDPVVVLEEGGEAASPREAAAELGGEGGTLVVGGFPEGSLQADVEAVADASLALGGEPLMAWTALSEVLAHVEEGRGVWDR